MTQKSLFLDSYSHQGLLLSITLQFHFNFGDFLLKIFRFHLFINSLILYYPNNPKIIIYFVSNFNHF